MPPDPIVEAMRARRYELRAMPLDRIYRQLFDAGLTAMTYDPRRDDLLFQSAQSDGKGGFVRPSASPDPRDALIAELCEVLERAGDFIQRESDLRDSSCDDEDIYTTEPRDLCVMIAAALRRARGQ